MRIKVIRYEGGDVEVMLESEDGKASYMQPDEFERLVAAVKREMEAAEDHPRIAAFDPVDYHDRDD